MGLVVVNGHVVTELGSKADATKDFIKVSGKQINKPQSMLYYMLNKPVGYVCSNTRIDGEKIIFDLFPKKLQRLFSVGRLDKDAKGLIILTNDGEFANRVVHPSYNISKEYIVKVGEKICDYHIRVIEKGTYVDNHLVTPYKVKMVKRSTLSIILKDGKRHEIKYLVDKAQLSLVELKRVKIGNLSLGDIPNGSYTQLTNRDLDRIFQ